MNVFSRALGSKIERKEVPTRKPAPQAAVSQNGFTDVLPSANGDSYGSLSSKRPGTHDVNDPITMHLLMENALGDSQAYEILSLEDLDSRKLELSNLATRIEATERKLGLETKVRDAANSANRLQRSGSKSSVSAKTSEEAAESARKCEVMSQELATLQKQEHLLQKCLLEHTAGVLQMTHKGYLKKAPTDETLTNGNGIKGDHGDFGTLSLYEPSSLTFDIDTGSGTELKEQKDMISNVERRVEELNTQLRQMVVALKPQPQDIPALARQLREDPENPAKILNEQVDFLEKCLSAVHYHQQDRSVLDAQNQEAEQRLQGINAQLYQVASRTHTDKFSTMPPPPPAASGGSLQLHTEYLSSLQNSVQQQLEQVERNDAVLGGLWGVLSPPEKRDQYSLQNLASKVQEMNIKYSGLQDQKNVLTRQIQQQRELNESADSAKERKFNDMKDELDQTKSELENSRHQANIHLEKLTSTIAEVEAVKATLTNVEQSRATAEQSRTMVDSQALLNERHAKKQVEDQLQRANNQLSETSSLMEANVMALKSDLEKRSAVVAKAEKVIIELEGEVVRLQTELTIAKAELDSAHGSRAERAAEAAGDPALQKRVQTLQKELSETISDYEAMTKATIEYEKEREQSENLIDSLRDRVESLEIQINDEKIHSLGAKSPSASSERGGMAGSTSTGVLKNEFKKMMKETKAEHSKALRAEQEERRKLESMVRALKKEQLPNRGSGR